MARQEDTGSDQSRNNIQEGGLRGAGVVAYAGLLFVGFTAVLCGIVAFRLLNFPKEFQGWQQFAPELILCGMAAFTALIGVSLLRSGGLAATQPNRVINRSEWDAICDEVKAGNEEPVTQYIRLTSLTGFTGMFTKLGLSGLPLATIALTLIFSLLFLQNAEFLELAKLTLGAFIGSFVQKQVGNQGGGSVKLPGGETLKIRSSDPV